MPNDQPVSSGKTRMLRVLAATQQKIAWLAELEGTSSAAVVESLLADRLAERYRRVEAAVQTIESAKSQVTTELAGC